jgi:dolichyl-phosphate-mannose-protein mannosyltransferase
MVSPAVRGRPLHGIWYDGGGEMPLTANPPAAASRSSAQLATVVLLLIVAVGIVLRLRGIRFGLPAVYNPDEIAIMSRALAFAKGDVNPHNFLYPTLYFYALFAWIAAYFLLGRASGVFASAAEFERQFFLDPSGIYLAGRMLGVVCGALTIVALYRLARRWFDRSTSLSAAALLAVAPFAVRDAHYVKHDVPATLLTVLAYVAMGRVVAHLPHRSHDASTARPPSPASLAMAGAACGLAWSTHYYTIFLALPLAWTAWLCSPDARAFVRSLAVAGIPAIAVFFLTSPFILVEPATAIRDVVANRQIVVDRAAVGADGRLTSTVAYARMLWKEAVGWPVVVLALAGAAILLAAAWRRAVLLLSFVIPFLAFITNTVPAGRYLNPALPFVALLAAVAVARAARLVGPRAAPVAMVALTFVAAAPGLMASVRTGTFFRQTDTRTLAQQFIEHAIPPGRTVALQPYSTPLRPSRASLSEGLAAHGVDESAAPAKFARQLALEPYPEPSYRLIYIGDGGLDLEKIYVGYRALGGSAGLTALRHLGVQYVVVKRYNAPEPETLPFLEALASEGIRLAVFSPFSANLAERERGTVQPYLHNTDTPLSPALERPGPVIEVWKLP